MAYRMLQAQQMNKNPVKYRKAVVLVQRWIRRWKFRRAVLLVLKNKAIERKVSRATKVNNGLVFI
jgi:hypothetical protein